MVTKLGTTSTRIKSCVFWRNKTRSAFVSGIILILIIGLIPIQRTVARVLIGFSPASTGPGLIGNFSSDSSQPVMALALVNSANPFVATMMINHMPTSTEAKPNATSVLEAYSRLNSATSTTPCGCVKNSQAQPTHSFMLPNEPTQQTHSILDVQKPERLTRSVLPGAGKKLMRYPVLWPISFTSPSRGTGQFAPPPANDLCEDAILLPNIFPFFAISGTTIDATVDDVGIRPETGVWYKVTGRDTRLTATTCSPETNYDTQISVFIGECNMLTLVASNDDYFSCPVSNFQSLVEWPAAAGVEYYILVHGFGPAIGDFSLTLGLGPPIPPVNDLCQDAIPIESPSAVNGSTRNATLDNTSFCETSNTAPGIWYSVIGDGNTITATCSPATNYDTKISVFTGECDALTCVGGNDDDFSCPNSPRASTVSWFSELGVEYLILVHGFSSLTGDFALSLFGDTAPPDVMCSVGVDSLWPPTHQLIDVGLEIVVVDDQDPDPTIEVLVFSDEDDDEQTGAGNHSHDAALEGETLRLSAERKGNGDGRVYLIVVTATDAAGNVGFDWCTVLVPHDRSRSSRANVADQAASAEAFCNEFGEAPPDFVPVGEGS